MSGVSRLARGGASVALGLALVTPLALPRVGLSEGEVAGHSMEPTYHVGDYVFTRQATPVVGDVVRVRADDEIFVHRIVTDDGRGHFTTKGDGNRTADGQTVTAAQIDGVVVGHLGGWQAETWRWLTVWPARAGLALLAVLLWPTRRRRRRPAPVAPGDVAPASPAITRRELRNA